MKNRHWFLLMFLLPALIVAGCTTESSDSGTSNTTSQPAGETPTVDTSSPDSMVKEVARGISTGNAEVVWNVLPASYQKDVQDVAKLLGDKMDGEVWNQSFETLGKITKILKDKKSFILGNMMVQGMMAQSPIQQADIDKSWNATVGFFDTIITSEISTIDGLRKVNVADYVKKTGGKLLKQSVGLAQMNEDGKKWLEMMKSPEVKILSHDGDKATLEATADGQTEAIKVVKVEGRWIPEEMAMGWKDGLAEAKSSIEGMDFSGEAKQQFQGMMMMTNGVLDQLLAAESQAEFDQAIMGIMGMMGSMGGPGGG